MMHTNLRELPIKERVELVEELWDSIAADQEKLKLTPEQASLLDARLKTYEMDREPGRSAVDVIAEVRKKL